MALVLCAGADGTLITTRELILEQAGHKVIGAVDGNELLRACSENQFDVAVIGQTVSPNEKRHIYDLVRQHCPSAKILELVQPFEGRTLLEADDWLDAPVRVPPELGERVSKLASNS